MSVTGSFWGRLVKSMFTCCTKDQKQATQLINGIMQCFNLVRAHKQLLSNMYIYILSWGPLKDINYNANYVYLELFNYLIIELYVSLTHYMNNNLNVDNFPTPTLVIKL